MHKLFVNWQILEKTRETFISNLKLFREREGLTQFDLADKIGLSLRGYQKYEQGESWPSPATIDQLALVLKVEPSAFFNGTEKQSPSQTAMAQAITALQNEVDQLKALRSAVSDETLSLFENASAIRRAAALEILGPNLPKRRRAPSPEEVTARAVLAAMDAAPPVDRIGAMYLLTRDEFYLEQLRSMAKLTGDKGAIWMASALGGRN